MKGRETAEIYQPKREILGELENLSNNRLIDLYYADESRVSLEPCVPYGWQFADEEVSVPSAKGDGLNCFALFSRNNRCLIETRPRNHQQSIYFRAVGSFIFQPAETDGCCFGQRADSHIRNYQKTN